MSMKKVYVVNELCELEEDNYMECHGVFVDREAAYQLAWELYEQAKQDLGDDDCCDAELKVCNDDNIITLSVDEVDLHEE